MKIILTIFLIGIAYFATAQTKKLTKEDIVKDGTVLKYAIGDTGKIYRSFNVSGFSEGEQIDTLIIKLVSKNNKLYATNKDIEFEIFNDKTPNYYLFSGDFVDNYEDLILSKKLYFKDNIDTYNFLEEKTQNSKRYNYSPSSMEIMYNNATIKLSSIIFKSEVAVKGDSFTVYFFNKDAEFPLMLKKYLIIDKNNYHGLYFKLISITTKK